MRAPATWLVVFLAGCDGCTAESVVDAPLVEVGGDAVGLWAGTAQGPGGAVVPVLTVNEVGAAVPGGAVTFASAASLAATEATPDPFGWSEAEVSAEASGAFTVQASSSAGAAEGWALVTAQPDPDLAFPGWVSGGTGSPVAAAGAGLAVARGEAVWWSPLSGGAPVRVAALSSAVRSLRTVHLDEDGVADLMVLGEDELVLLRGRPDGGLAFLAGWRPEGDALRAAVAGRADEDALTDLLVVVGDANTATVVWMPGDGLGGWEATATLDVDFAVYAASFEDLDEDGVAEITLLTGDGITRRYELLSDGWQATAGMDAELGLAEGANMLGGFDIDGDLRDDTLVWGPRADADEWSAYMLMADDELGTVYALTSSVAPLAGLAASVVDADVDGELDVIFAAPGFFGRTVWSDTAGSYVVYKMSNMPDAPVIDTPDVDADGLPDVVYSGPVVFSTEMEQVADDPETEDDEAVPWRERTPFDGLFDLGLEGDPWAGDVSGDGVVDLVSLVAGGVQSFLGSPQTDVARPSFKAAKAAAFEVGQAGVDLAVCGEDVWALVEGGTGTALWHLRVGAAGTFSGAASTPVSGTLVVCGAFAEGDAVVVAADGTRTWVDTALQTTTAAGEAGWGDAVAADRDGDGVDELLGCVGVCSAAAGDFDADGTTDWAWSDGVDTTLSLGGLESTLGVGGALSAGDLDGDGVPELLAQSEGVLAAWRGLGGVPGLPSLHYIARDTRGRALAGDLDGNLVPDAFWLGDERDPADSADWTGTLLYAEAPDPSSP